MATIYSLTFSNGKQYIGMTKQPLRRRIACHRDYARKGCGFAVGRAWSKYGEPEVKTLAVVEGHMVRETERRAIAAFNTMVPNGYNLLPGGEGGHPVSEETREKMSRGGRGKSKSAEHRAKISAGQIGRSGTWTGKKQSSEHVERRIAIHRGAKRSPEARARIAAGIAKARAAKRSVNS